MDCHWIIHYLPLRMPRHEQIISKRKLEEIISLKAAYNESLKTLPPVGDDLGIRLPEHTEAMIEHEQARVALPEYTAFKQLIRSLSDPQLKYLQAVAFYGRSSYQSFSEALNDAEPGSGEFDYTFGLVSESEYLEEGFEKLNRRREI